MDRFVPVAVDIAALGIVVYCALVAAKKGFLRTVVQMIAYVLIVIAASSLSHAVAPVVYEQVVLPSILRDAQPKSQERPSKSNASLVGVFPQTRPPQNPTAWTLGLSVQAETDAQTLSKLDQTVEKIWDDTAKNAKDALGSISGMLPSSADLQDSLLKNMDLEKLADGLIDELAEATLRPMVVSAISILGFVLFFTVFSMLSNAFLSALGIINHLPVVGPLNAILGGIVGILQGLLIVWVLAVSLGGLLHLFPNGWWIFNQQTIDGSFLVKYFADFRLLFH